MLVFVVSIISINVIQEWKTDKTLEALRELSAPHVKVIRDGQEKMINSTDLVPEDLMIVSEGTKVPADGKIIKCNDLCVDESSLTGESEGVWKVASRDNIENNKEYWKKDYCYAGTLITQGSGIILVDKIGALTEYGKIGVAISSVPENPTPLQKQIQQLVKSSAMIATILFIVVSLVTYLNIPGIIFKDRAIESILAGITLAMAMIPEEFPVILTVFLSMGAWRLAKNNSLVRKLTSVETLGSISVLCVDKTGTITINQMTVRKVWSLNNDTNNLCKTLHMSCEIEAYDPMEKAMLSYCEGFGISKDSISSSELVTEYPFTNETKMMGHVWKNENGIIVAAKGSPEKIMSLCKIPPEQLKLVEEKIIEMSKKGLRVIALAETNINSQDNIPSSLLDCRLQLTGIIGLADPPRESIKENIEKCTAAGIRVIMITGDNGVTASAIASEIGMSNNDKFITGDKLNELSDDELRKKVGSVNIFARVIPKHKMRIVKAFKDNGEVVAMTGDGVNDAPALKYADIGISMGKRGSEVSREASDIILLDDNFSTIVDTIKDGRRIYDSIQKAIGYVFAIHIPIALACLFAPLMGVVSSQLMLLPLHVVLLELIIDPTCSIVLERQPSEKGIMQRPPRNPNSKILSMNVIFKSLLQGITMFVASFGTYYVVFKSGADVNIARSMGLAIIMLSNILLIYVNTSNYESIFKSIKQITKDRVVLAINSGIIILLLIILYSPLNYYLKLAPLSLIQLLLVCGISFIAVMWYEVVKIVRSRSINPN